MRIRPDLHSFIFTRANGAPDPVYAARTRPCTCGKSGQAIKIIDLTMSAGTGYPALYNDPGLPAPIDNCERKC